MQSPEFLNAEEVALYLHLGKNTVYSLAKSGQIASYRVGRKLKFTMEDVEAYISSTHVNADTTRDTTPTQSNAGSSESADGSEIVEAISFDAPTGKPFIIAGAEQAADIIASTLNMQALPATRLVCGSYTALVNLYAGKADAAVVNLYDQASNSWNIPYVRNLAPGASVIVIRLNGRKQGLIVQAGNPKRLTTWGGLLREGVRLANRAKGSGSRVLLDEKLRSLEARAENIDGYSDQAHSGAEAIQRVAGGLADVTIGHERETYGISGTEFVPLQTEWVDIVIRKCSETRTAIREIKDALADEQVRRELCTLAPCDIAKLGSIVYES